MDKIRVLIKGQIRIILVETTSTINEALEVQKPTPLSAVVLANTIATFSLLAWSKQMGRTSVYVKGNGAVGSIVYEVSNGQDIRAMVSNLNVATDYDDKDINLLPLIIGVGDFGIIRIVNEIGGQHFGSEINIMKGDLITDLAYYYYQSEQIYTAVQTSVKMESKDRVRIAYGALFQMLPNHSEAEIEWVENFVKEHNIKLIDDMSAYEKLIDAKFLEEKNIRWFCGCSEEKMSEAISVLSEEEKESIIAELGHIEIVCQFCGKKYSFFKS